MSLSPVPTSREIDKAKKVELDPVWIAWFNSVAFWLFPNGQFGTTAKRPTSNLYVGREYFDTTLGFPVWVKAISPSIVWVRYDGTPV